MILNLEQTRFWSMLWSYSVLELESVGLQETDIFVMPN